MITESPPPLDILSQPRLHKTQLTTHSLEEHRHAQGDSGPEQAVITLGESARTEGEEFSPGNAKSLCPPFQDVVGILRPI